ncbi:MAG TPA: zinc ribbon domain-containing protein [Candidatus Nanopelagicaceae bacterium]|nr:zinc ribbon domain-containing protein [Candidatus Nanopelagicaceae bacterium]
MSQDKIRCSKCGNLVQKDLTYCIHCGSLLEPAPTSSPAPIQSTSSTPPPTTPIKTKTNIPYKTIIYFAAVALIDLIVSFFVMNGFQLPIASFGQLYLIFFLVVAFSLGLLWLAGANTSSSGGSGGGYEGCGYVIGAIVGIAIGVPIILASTFSTIATSIGDAISEAINNAISDAFTEMFADVEIPGFEPLLFLGLFAMLSIIIMYRYHLKTKKNSLSN